ncbi:RNA 2',3'-cyclic phosphodiesterase [Thermasporomyces composti]|uniref:RNA 2',3'-cyclic phosphodiesterase n=1 Tax=Thermasporomyces composti TaxID=696763 RepID=UPI001B86FAB8|nr:RNA 2',3'-cyclic phosphodiesterase [Thermasporomyces composti]
MSGEAWQVRLFVALVPPASVLDDVAVVVSDIRGRVDADVRLRQEQWRWTERAQWHLTLAFLGEVGDDVVPGLKARLARVARRSQPLHLHVRGGGGFGSARNARVLWSGVHGDVDELRRLAGSVAAAARRVGIDVPDRRYRPHLTLARLRVPADVRPVVEWLSDYTGPVWEADRLELVRSYLRAGPNGGSRYETIHAWPLGRPGSAAE